MPGLQENHSSNSQAQPKTNRMNIIYSSSSFKWSNLEEGEPKQN